MILHFLVTSANENRHRSAKYNLKYEINKNKQRHSSKITKVMALQPEGEENSAVYFERRLKLFVLSENFVPEFLEEPITALRRKKDDFRGLLIGKRETALAQWLRRCDTNPKVAGSIPAGVTGFFIDIKSFRSHYCPGVD